MKGPGNPLDARSISGIIMCSLLGTVPSRELYPVYQVIINRLIIIVINVSS